VTEECVLFEYVLGGTMWKLFGSLRWETECLSYDDQMIPGRRMYDCNIRYEDWKQDEIAMNSNS
jgi:hypothetical protein